VCCCTSQERRLQAAAHSHIPSSRALTPPAANSRTPSGSSVPPPTVPRHIFRGSAVSFPSAGSHIPSSSSVPPPTVPRHIPSCSVVSAPSANGKAPSTTGAPLPAFDSRAPGGSAESTPTFESHIPSTTAKSPLVKSQIRRGSLSAPPLRASQAVATSHSSSPSPSHIPQLSPVTAALPGAHDISRLHQPSLAQHPRPSRNLSSALADLAGSAARGGGSLSQDEDLSASSARYADATGRGSSLSRSEHDNSLLSGSLAPKSSTPFAPAMPHAPAAARTEPQRGSVPSWLQPTQSPLLVGESSTQSSTHETGPPNTKIHGADALAASGRSDRPDPLGRNHAAVGFHDIAEHPLNIEAPANAPSASWHSSDTPPAHSDPASSLNEAPSLSSPQSSSIPRLSDGSPCFKALASSSLASRIASHAGVGPQIDEPSDGSPELEASLTTKDRAAYLMHNAVQPSSDRPAHMHGSSHARLAAPQDTLGQDAIKSAPPAARGLPLVAGAGADRGPAVGVVGDALRAPEQRLTSSAAPLDASHSEASGGNHGFATVTFLPDDWQGEHLFAEISATDFATLSATSAIATSPPLADEDNGRPSTAPSLQLPQPLSTRKPPLPRPSSLNTVTPQNLTPQQRARHAEQTHVTAADNSIVGVGELQGEKTPMRVCTRAARTLSPEHGTPVMFDGIAERSSPYSCISDQYASQPPSGAATPAGGGKRKGRGQPHIAAPFDKAASGSPESPSAVYGRRVNPGLPDPGGGEAMSDMTLTDIDSSMTAHSNTAELCAQLGFDETTQGASVQAVSSVSVVAEVRLLDWTLSAHVFVCSALCMPSCAWYPFLLQCMYALAEEPCALLGRRSLSFLHSRLTSPWCLMGMAQRNGTVTMDQCSTRVRPPYVQNECSQKGGSLNTGSHRRSSEMSTQVAHKWWALSLEDAKWSCF
jgi:hypothetical protein